MVSTCQDPDRQIRIFGWYAIFVRIVRIYGQKMVKKSQNQNQDISHFVFRCVRIMSGYFRNFNPPSPRSAPFSYLINIVTFDVCWGVSDYIVQSSIPSTFPISYVTPPWIFVIINILLCYFISSTNGRKRKQKAWTTNILPERMGAASRILEVGVWKKLRYHVLLQIVQPH